MGFPILQPVFVNDSITEAIPVDRIVVKGNTSGPCCYFETFNRAGKCPVGLFLLAGALSLHHWHPSYSRIPYFVRVISYIKYPYAFPVAGIDVIYYHPVIYHISVT